MKLQKGGDGAQADQNILKRAWAAFYAPADDDRPHSVQPLGWLLGSFGLILFLSVALLAYFSIKRSETAMSDLLAEKGTSLLMVLESALRTGMRGAVGLQLQPLLQEMTRSPDIEFVAVTMPDGTILAHSDRARIGENLRLDGDQLLGEAELAALAPGDEEKWQILQIEGKRIFLLFRHFTLGHKDWAKDVPEPTIFLGMDISPFEITRTQNRNYVFMLCVVTFLIGLIGLMTLYYAERAKESGKKQKLAEREIVRLETEMRRQEKLAAIGTLAAGVAHEIRNPLSSIKGYATYFRQKFAEDSEDREAANVMLNEVTRLNRVISDLLGLSAQKKLQLKPVNIELVINHVVRLLRQNATNREISIDRKFARTIPPALVDMERLSQALLNLCLNGFDAMKNGGHLTLAVSGGKNRICILVKDTGCGIPPEIMEKIFDPYFTTKGSGTGLGLPMVHKIIREHNGEIDVSSSLADEHGENVGTIFRIWMPVAHHGAA